MNIYLDIDGVLLTRDKKPSQGVTEFLRKVTDRYDVYWLTTHCKGDADVTVEYLKKYLPLESHEFLEKIHATNWDFLKTDAIDFSKDFLWFDDYVMEAEQRILKEKGCLKKWVRVEDPLIGNKIQFL